MLAPTAGAPHACVMLRRPRFVFVLGVLMVFSMRSPAQDQDGKVQITKGQTLTQKDLYTMSYFVKGVQGTIPK